VIVAIRGVDGAGKSTTVANAVQQLHVRGLHARGVKFSLVSNPAFRRYRRLLYSQPAETVAPLRRALAVAETLRTYYDDVLPAHRRGEVVVCDRYWTDTVAYLQIRGLANAAEVGELAALRRSDLEVVLDVPLPLAEERCRQLGERWGEQMLRNLSMVTRDLTEHPRSNTVILDGRRPAPEVAESVVILVDDRLARSGDARI
jgi:dTMP kinase